MQFNSCNAGQHAHHIHGDANNGIREFIEIGPGKVLSGLVKRIIRDAKASSINSIEDIKNNIK